MTSILRVKTLEDSLRSCSHDGSAKVGGDSSHPQWSVTNSHQSATSSTLCSSLSSLPAVAEDEQGNPDRMRTIEKEDYTKHDDEFLLSGKNSGDVVMGAPDNLAVRETKLDFSSVSSPSLTSFGTVFIREYPRTIGDNPSCSGCPIGIDWVPIKEQEISFDVYEAHREGNRRLIHEMRLPSSTRDDMLKDWGVPLREIYEVRRAMKEIQIQRIKSARDKEELSFLGITKKRLSQLIKPLKTCRTKQVCGTEESPQ